MATGGDYGGDLAFDCPPFPRPILSYAFIGREQPAPQAWARESAPRRETRQRGFVVLITTERCGGGNVQKLNYGSPGKACCAFTPLNG